MSAEFQRRHVEIATWQTEIQHTWPSETKKKLENLLNLGFPAFLAALERNLVGRGLQNKSLKPLCRNTLDFHNLRVTPKVTLIQTMLHAQERQWPHLSAGPMTARWIAISDASETDYSTAPADSASGGLPASTDRPSISWPYICLPEIQATASRIAP